jgi:hypothetical protein
MRFAAVLVLAWILAAAAPPHATAEEPAAAAESAGERISARLLAPLTTKFSRKGDLVSALITEPASYQNAMLEGEVHEVHGGAGNGGRAVLALRIFALHSNGQTIPVAVSLIDASNSKREAQVDEAGSSLELAKPGGGTVGKLTSLLHRGSGGEAGGVILRIEAKAQDLSLDVGSQLTLRMAKKTGK